MHIETQGVKCFLLALLLFAGAPAIAQTGLSMSTGQTLYLPVYSHIFYGDPGREDQPRALLLSTLVSIRNSDPKRSINVTSAQYFDTNGRKIKEFIPAPVTLQPLGTHEIFIAKSDSAGGSGANFLISWESRTPANPPIVEGVHAEVLGTRSLAFITVARPIDPR